MLNKQNRITRNKDFDRAFKTGQSFYGKVLGIKAVENDLNMTRFGILISTKVSKKAVVRNHFKRQIRAHIQGELPKLKKGYDIVLIVFSLILDKDFEEIHHYLVTGLNKLNLYNLANIK